MLEESTLVLLIKPRLLDQGHHVAHFQMNLTLILTTFHWLTLLHCQERCKKFPKMFPAVLHLINFTFFKHVLPYKVVLAIVNICSSLQQNSPGNLNHARWLTKANRILRLYMSQRRPSVELVKVCSFILNVYSPSWFHIKQHNSCQDGAKNFFFLLQLCQQLSNEAKTLYCLFFKITITFAIRKIF